MHPNQEGVLGSVRASGVDLADSQDDRLDRGYGHRPWTRGRTHLARERTLARRIEAGEEWQPVGHSSCRSSTCSATRRFSSSSPNTLSSRRGSRSSRRWLAQSELGILTNEAAAAIAAEATGDKVDLGRLREQTRVVGYPILPLLEQIKAASSPDVARYLHWGATTQDVMDTGLALTLARALDRVETLERTLGDAIASRADEHRATVMAGRTHGQHAVPITFGGKLAVWLAELERHLQRLRSARGRAAVVQLFGAAGTGAALGPEIRELRRRLAAHLSLEMVDVPWHTARDGLAEVGFVLAAVAATCGKIAREVIELSRPEIGELKEAEDTSAAPLRPCLRRRTRSAARRSLA